LTKKLSLTIVLGILVTKISPHYRVIRNLGVCLFTTQVILNISSKIYIFFLEEKEALEMNFLYRIGYLRLTGFSEHSFFYFAWSLSDLVCNASGLGFNGYDSNGKPKWDLLTNFKIFNIDVTNRTTEFVHYFYFAAF
jgi:lysophospholipid acyltransferase 1/2